MGGTTLLQASMTFEVNVPNFVLERYHVGVVVHP
jgi:hypothetical protein